MVVGAWKGRERERFGDVEILTIRMGDAAKEYRQA